MDTPKTKPSLFSRAWNAVFWDTIETLILGSRVLLVPLYLVLLFQIVIIFIDFFHIIGLFSLFGGESHGSSMLTAHTIQTLELLDITMIANLVWLISAGSYYVFVDNTSDGHSKPRPPALKHVSAGLLKEKMAGSIIGISSVHLLQIFLDISESHEPVDSDQLFWIVVLHFAFIVGAVAFAIMNAMPHHSHKEEGPHE